MKANVELPLNNKEALVLLKTECEKHETTNDKIRKIKLTTKMKDSDGKVVAALGSGFLEQKLSNEAFDIKIGIDPAMECLHLRYKSVNTENFITSFTTLYHELAHLDHKTADDTAEEILLSDLSTFHNPYYYKTRWPTFPHEISAEHTAIETSQVGLVSLNKNYNNSMLLNHINRRLMKTQYILSDKRPFLNLSKANAAMEKAYDKALNGKREPLNTAFFRSDDELARLMADENGVVRSEYQPFIDQINGAETGKEWDRKMASLVSYLHPELQAVYKKLDFEKLKPEIVFGIPMPETLEEIKEHMNLNKIHDVLSENIESEVIIMDMKSKRKELLRLDDRSLVDRILAFPNRERLNRDEDGKRRPYPSAEMAVRARRSMEKNPEYQISQKQRFAMADSFAKYSTDQLKVAGIKFAKADPNMLKKNILQTEGVKTVYEMQYHLVPEPENEHDKNAVAVYVNNENDDNKTRIGYLPGAYVAEHPIVHPMTVKGTLTDHSNGHFKTISYVMDMDTEALDKEISANRKPDMYTYRMPFILNGDAKPGAAEYLNAMTWSGTGGVKEGWTERLNGELEYWGVNGRAENVYFEFPGGRAGNIIVETAAPFNGEAISTCGSYFHYSLEAGISGDLRREGLVDAPANMSAINTRERTYFSLQAEPSADDFANAVGSLNVEGQDKAL